MRMDFGDGFAYKGSDAQLGKSSEGEQNGQEEQETIEEGEKAGSNKAADGVRRANQTQTVGVDCHEMSAPSRGCGTRATDFTIDKGF
jgi:hypothetical protein